MLILLCLVLGGAVCCLLVLYQYNSRHQIRYLQSLCELRQNSLDIHRHLLKIQTETRLYLRKELDDVIRYVRQFILDYHRIRRELANREDVSAALRKVREINEDLVHEFSKILEENSHLNEMVAQLKAEAAEGAKLREEICELRMDHTNLLKKYEKLQARNQDLEYAINLESISMIEAYQERDKLFSAIDDVRRSLTRILNPA